MRIEFKEFLHNIKEHDYDVCGQYKVDQSEAKKLIQAFEEVERPTKNVTPLFMNQDNFKCRECGIWIEGYVKCKGVDGVEDYTLKYCPECGRKIVKKEFKRLGHEHDM